MADFLLLGPLLLQDFEMPQRVAWGGAQRVVIHRLPGGRRVIDSMGRDDRPIGWSGVFTGADAALRARLLDLMRADGSVWPLIWDTFLYSVVVARFEADFVKPNWIPYRVELAVLRDEAEGLVEDVLSTAASALLDGATAEGLAPGYGFGAGDLSRANGLLGGDMALAGGALAGASLGPAGLLTAQSGAGSLARLSAARGYGLRAEGEAARAGADGA